MKARLCNLLRWKVGKDALVNRHQGRVSAQRKVDSRVGHEVCLKLDHVNIYGAREAIRSGAAWYNLADDAIEVSVRGTADLQVGSAHVIDGFVVEQDAAIGEVHAVVSREQRIIRLNDDGRDSGKG